MKAAFILFLFLTVNETFAQLSLQKEQKNKDLKVLLISDLNDSYGSVEYSTEVKEIVGKVKDLKPDLILCAGDMVAGQKSSLTPQQIDAMWKGFDETVMKPISILKIPFGFTVGNHDASPNFINDREAATSYWKANISIVNLTFVDSTYYPYYFSYMKNNVFIASWDASSSKISSQVKEWLKQQFNSDVAKKSRYRILLGHLPLYAIVDAKNRPGEVLADASEMENLMNSLNINIYIAGHQHAYFPGQSKSLTLLHSGCLGGGPRSFINDSQPARKAYAWIEIPKRKVKKGFKVNGFDGTTNEIIPLESLPYSIKGFNGSGHRIKE